MAPDLAYRHHKAPAIPDDPPLSSVAAQFSVRRSICWLEGYPGLPWEPSLFRWEILDFDSFCPLRLEWMPTRPNWLRSLKPLFILSSMHVGFILKSCLSG